MKTRWKQHQDENPDTADTVQAGLDKLEEYRERTELVPAHVLAMGMLMLHFLFLYSFIFHSHKPIYEASVVYEACTRECHIG